MHGLHQDDEFIHVFDVQEKVQQVRVNAHYQHDRDLAVKCPHYTGFVKIGFLFFFLVKVEVDGDRKNWHSAEEEEENDPELSKVPPLHN